jgi:hypothetical protein
LASILKRTYRGLDGKVKTCRHYSIEYTGLDGKRKRAKGYVDKQATIQLAARLEKAAARGEEGMVNPTSPTAARPSPSTWRRTWPTWRPPAVRRSTSRTPGTESTFCSPAPAGRASAT